MERSNECCRWQRFIIWIACLLKKFRRVSSFFPDLYQNIFPSQWKFQWVVGSSSSTLDWKTEPAARPQTSCSSGMELKAPREPWSPTIPRWKTLRALLWYRCKKFSDFYARVLEHCRLTSAQSAIWWNSAWKSTARGRSPTFTSSTSKCGISILMSDALLGRLRGNFSLSRSVVFQSRKMVGRHGHEIQETSTIPRVPHLPVGTIILAE